ncbi:16S rRNA (cytidine(1402)-2'-O)-methyltransferase [Peredibacter starrii]|uniref:16S rRNA (Cytidine(1402)-2'-O)-methyltransferase n=1 Tax=Peredibacter starrii TaxID=28202 RepID=A0AAX4HKH8_9BACT|nr:16S rRNA (cytidine(1402)-2'-O)-methyltransferase [Peredibacter starrii]WPU63747.1 16S rRNA (cytidine(1402)-2'-O)-methyltransferase [Peredibacter starrii]
MGKIILLNTPIGNLGDMTPRVSEALKTGVQFAVEDTRVFKDLLNHIGVSLQGKRIVSLHDQSEGTQIGKLIEMARHDDLYVASEAGSPIVSDPAYPLVIAAYEQGIKVESYSGVSSPIMALELSGLPPIPFQFHGFLPRESGKRAKIFQNAGYGTHIFFEAPTRVEETLDELSEILPEAELAVVRELSKKFEQVIKLKAGEWKERKKEVNFKGEFIFLFHKKEESAAFSSEIRDLAQEIVATGATPKQTAKLLGLILDRPTKDIYSEISRGKRQD